MLTARGCTAQITVAPRRSRSTNCSTAGPSPCLQYKFIVDGQWRHDPNLPSMYDDMGNINNVLEVQVGAQE